MKKKTLEFLKGLAKATASGAVAAVESGQLSWKRVAIAAGGSGIMYLLYYLAG